MPTQDKERKDWHGYVYPTPTRNFSFVLEVMVMKRVCAIAESQRRKPNFMVNDMLRQAVGLPSLLPADTRGKK